MEATELTAPRRRFAGRRGTAETGETEFTALAEVLLSPEPVGPVAATRATEPAAGEGSPIPEAPVPRGLYVLVPAGVDPAGRRDAALTAARRLAPHREPAAVFVFENGLVDAHALGEMACGRLGPQNYLGAADMDRTVGDLVGQCNQIGLVVLDPPNGQLRLLQSAACRTIFLATPNAESVVETYRALKTWRLGGMPSDAAVLFAGSRGARGASDLERRLRRAAQGFLGCDLAIQRVVSVGADEGAGELPQTLRILSQTPADQVWPRLLAAAGHAAPHAATCVEDGLPPSGTAPDAGVSETIEPSPPAPGPATAVCPAFGLWEPRDRCELTSVVREQIPWLFGGSLTFAFDVDVDEPGAPPLAAVRNDGALVAVLVPEPGEAVDTQAAEQWMRVHRSLLARAYPTIGIAAEPTVVSMVLSVVRRSQQPDGVRRLVPVRLGGHKGVLLLP